MERSRRIRSAVILEAALLFLMGVILWENGKLPQKSAVETTADGYIKWVDFNVSYEALSRAYEYDIGSYGEKQHLDWIDLLAYVGAKNGGDFGAGKNSLRGGYDGAYDRRSEDVFLLQGCIRSGSWRYGR